MDFKRDLVFAGAVVAVLVVLRLLAAPLARQSAPEDYPGAGPVLLRALDAGWSPSAAPAAPTETAAPVIVGVGSRAGEDVIR